MALAGPGVPFHSAEEEGSLAVQTVADAAACHSIAAQGRHTRRAVAHNAWQGWHSVGLVQPLAPALLTSCIGVGQVVPVLRVLACALDMAEVRQPQGNDLACVAGLEKGMLGEGTVLAAGASKLEDFELEAAAPQSCHLAALCHLLTEILHPLARFSCEASLGFGGLGCACLDFDVRALRGRGSAYPGFVALGSSDRGFCAWTGCACGIGCASVICCDGGSGCGGGAGGCHPQAPGAHVGPPGCCGA